MRAKNVKIGVFLILIISTLGFTSCEEQEVATATIEVLEEYTASQGQIHQTRLVEGAEVRVYVPLQRAQHLETVLYTDDNGKVDFVYEYTANALCDVSFDGRTVNGSRLVLELGETHVTTVILPE